MKVPGKGESAVLGVDETDSGQAAAVVFDAFHGPTLPARERRVLDKIARGQVVRRQLRNLAMGENIAGRVRSYTTPCIGANCQRT
ncbi:hypothetical protein D9M68_983730 [compost metagenome]